MKQGDEFDFRLAGNDVVMPGALSACQWIFSFSFLIITREVIAIMLKPGRTVMKNKTTTKVAFRLTQTDHSIRLESTHI